MTQTLPSVAPNINGLTYNDIVANTFTYGLSIDRYAFGYWAEKVQDQATYYTEDIDHKNAYKFSPFLISHHCNTSASIAACCMISERMGGVCLKINNDNNVMSTYRFTHIQW